MAKEYTIQSLSDYIEQINGIVLKSTMRTLPPKLLFRGHSDNTYELIPAVGRRPSQTWMNSWQMVENGLIETAQQKFPILFSASDYPAVLLAKLQHYGIYTRMLDLTANALVALYFACKNHQGSSGQDGEVLVFSANTVSAYNPFVNAIADTYRLTRNALIDVESYYYKVTKQSYFSSCLYPQLERDKERAKDFFVPAIEKPVFVEVGTICERQKNQGGYFLLFPNEIITLDNNTNCNGTEASFEQLYLSDNLVNISKEDDIIVKNLIIPKEIKRTLLDQLTRFGITQDFLFADSVDEVCSGIISEYRTHFPDN